MFWFGFATGVVATVFVTHPSWVKAAVGKAIALFKK